MVISAWLAGLQVVVLFIADGFQPFVRLRPRAGIFHFYVCCKMLKPGVFLCYVPMLHALRDVHNIASLERDGRLTPFLIPPSSADADEYLASSVVDMPIVPTTWLKCHIR